MESERAWLFPDTILKNRVNSVSYTITIVGDLFEVLSHCILGGIRTHGDGFADGTYADGSRQWESKVSQTRHYFKLTAGQTEAHLKTDTIITDWILWSYFYPHAADGGLTKRCDTVRDILNYVNENIKIVHWIPGETMARIMCHSLIRYRIYNSWHDAMGSPYRVYQLPQGLLDNIRWNGSYPQNTRLKSLNYEYCGERFKTNIFTLVEHQRPPEAKPQNGIPF